MSKKKPQPEEPAIPPASPTKPRNLDRHRPRRSVSLSPELYQQLQALADRNGRPVFWEVRLALQNHLRQNGLWPPPPADES